MIALKPMSKARTDGTRVLAVKVGDDQFRETRWRRLGSLKYWRCGMDYYNHDELSGHLPLPASAESCDVASTAGDWGEVCDEPDRIHLMMRIGDTLDPETLERVAADLAALAATRWLAAKEDANG